MGKVKTVDWKNLKYQKKKEKDRLIYRATNLTTRKDKGETNG